MSKYSDNPIHNVIEHQIMGGIRLCYDNDHHSSVLKLLYCGIDFMAFLSMPANGKEVTPFHFKRWAKNYIKLHGEIQLTGEELYAARNELLHTHRVHKASNEKDQRRSIVYAYKTEHKVMDIPLEPRVVLVPIEHLMQAFFQGIDKFLTDVYRNPQQTEIVEQRLRQVLVKYPKPHSGE